ncbi:MAG: hypothetical protein IGS03_14510 [Candidatus Sericytochromatia bacterium]|nr:hypothetical protein [Candidatus Sericytochromatia bacterium]
MTEAEAQAELTQLVFQVHQIVDGWDERGPTLLASALQAHALSVVITVLEQLEDHEEPAVYTALAKMLLARYAHESGDLEAYRAELWAVVQEYEQVPWSLRNLLMALLEITSQQPRSHPSFQTYHALGLMSEEVLQELETAIQTPSSRRRRLRIKMAQTAELPDLSSLTFEPVDQRVQSKSKTGLLTTLPGSIVLPSRPRNSAWIINWSELDINAYEQENLLKHLPGLYAMLESWDDDVTPFELAEYLQPHSIGILLHLSGVMLPHPRQSEYLRYLSLLIHLKLLRSDLPVINESLRRLFSEARAHVQAILPAVAYYLYCSSHTFYGIQEQALRQLESRHGYLYHLILDEWAKNKRIRSFVKTWLSRKEQMAVKLLNTSDWAYIFFLLNRGWARSVVRDVYGIFHGSSAFSNQVVLPETSKGFGNLGASSSAGFLATRQISDMLNRQARSQQDPQARHQQFEAYVSERFRKDVLRKDPRPSLNASTLKRLERLITSLAQRAEQQQLSLQLAARLGTHETLTAFTYLSPERLEWLMYELTRLWLGLLDPNHDQQRFEALMAGILYATVQGVEHAVHHRQQAQEVLQRLLGAVMNAVLDYALVSHRPAVWIRDLPTRLSQILTAEADQALQSLYEQFFLAQVPS